MTFLSVGIALCGVRRRMKRQEEKEENKNETNLGEFVHEEEEAEREGKNQ